MQHSFLPSILKEILTSPQTGTEICTKLGISYQTFYNHANRLLEMGLIYKERDPENKRKVLYHPDDYMLHKLNTDSDSTPASLSAQLSDQIQHDIQLFTQARAQRTQNAGLKLPIKKLSPDQDEVIPVEEALARLWKGQSNPTLWLIYALQAVVIQYHNDKLAFDVMKDDFPASIVDFMFDPRVYKRELLLELLKTRKRMYLGLVKVLEILIDLPCWQIVDPDWDDLDPDLPNRGWDLTPDSFVNKAVTASSVQDNGKQVHATPEQVAWALETTNMAACLGDIDLNVIRSITSWQSQPSQAWKGKTFMDHFNKELDELSMLLSAPEGIKEIPSPVEPSKHEVVEKMKDIIAHLGGSEKESTTNTN